MELEIHTSPKKIPSRRLSPKGINTQLGAVNDSLNLKIKKTRDTLVIRISVKMDDSKYINSRLGFVNSILKIGDRCFFKIETSEIKTKKFADKFPKLFRKIISLFVFLFHRVIAKSKITRNIYLKLTKRNTRYISKAEFIGRLYFNGFKVVNIEEDNNAITVLAEKTGMQLVKKKPSCDLFFKMNRVGLNGKIIQVYKLRTMAPYAEYAQKYIYEINGIDNSGKFKSDFRVTKWGQLFRKFWIDELPMLINLFKLEIKLVGVRPISAHYLTLYDPEIQKIRKLVKPGLLPCIYADDYSTLDKIMLSEKKYIISYLKNPYLTDMKYFLKILMKILFRKAKTK